MSDTTPHAEPPSIERAIDALDACSKAFLQFRATFDLMTGHYEPETLEANSEAWDRIWESIEKEFDKLAQAVTAVHEDKRQYTQNIAEVDVVKERYNQRIWGIETMSEGQVTVAWGLTRRAIQAPSSPFRGLL